jgi:hypothetical protein
VSVVAGLAGAAEGRPVFHRGAGGLKALGLDRLVQGGDWPAKAALASLFRDLGVADLETTSSPTMMVDRAPAHHEAHNERRYASFSGERVRPPPLQGIYGP